MADGQVKLDPEQMLLLSQQCSTVVNNCRGHAQTLVNGIDYVLNAAQGQFADGWRATMGQQRKFLETLLRKLDETQESLNVGGQGFQSHDTTGKQKVEAMNSQFLSGPLNA